MTWTYIDPIDQAYEALFVRVIVVVIILCCGVYDTTPFVGKLLFEIPNIP